MLGGHCCQRSQCRPSVPPASVSLCAGSSAGLAARSHHPCVTSWGVWGGRALPQLTQGRVEELAGSLAISFFFLFIFPVP